MSNTVKSERLKPMVISDPENGREYTLEYSRKSVVKAEQAGLDVNQLESKSMTMIPLLFWGAFIMHHPHMTKDQTDKILFDGLGGLNEDELGYLGRLYAAPFESLIASEDESNPRKMAVKFYRRNPKNRRPHTKKFLRRLFHNTSSWECHTNSIGNSPLV